MGGKLLIVEDEAKLARAMASLLRAEGYIVSACGGVGEAVDAVSTDPPSAAILDVNVADGLVYPVADRLQDAGIPYAFCSSMHPQSVPSRHQDATFLQKPFDYEQLIKLATSLFAKTGSSDS